MDTTLFANMPRSLTSIFHRRRFVGLALGSTIAAHLSNDGDARKRKKRRRHKKKRREDVQPPQPTEELDANCPVASGASHVANQPAVTFTPRRSGLLTRASVLLMDSQAGQDFTLILTHVGAEGTPAGGILAGEEVRDVPESGHGHPAQPLAVTFADPAQVVQGTRYALVVQSGQGFQIALGQTGQCPDSLAFDDTNRDGVFTAFPDRDFAFETFVLG
jgi:hypothetical protein